MRSALLAARGVAAVTARSNAPASASRDAWLSETCCTTISSDMQPVISFVSGSLLRAAIGPGHGVAVDTTGGANMAGLTADVLDVALLGLLTATAGADVPTPAGALTFT